MRAYKNVKMLKTQKTKEQKTSIFPRKKLATLGSLFCVLLSCSLCGFSLPYFGFESEVKRITSSWSPKLDDIGKLKFVTQEELMTETEVFSVVSEMNMPFENSYVFANSNGFTVSGLGSVIVKACLSGKVEKIEDKGVLKTITISHGKGLSSVYENLDNVGVKEGDRVGKNTPIGVSNNSQIGLKILLSGKIVAGLTVKNGEMVFE